MKINMDAPFDYATARAWDVLYTYDYSLGGLNLYMQMFEPQHMIIYTYHWPGGMWTGEAQCWNNGEDAGHITTRETYPTHDEALAAILREVKLCQPIYGN